MIPCDFLAAAQSHNPLGKHHPILISNYFAQTEALMKGKTPDEVRAELAAQGDGGERLEILVVQDVPRQPTNSFLYRKLTPQTLGLLDRACMSTAIFVQGAIWGINSFDQMAWNWQGPGASYPAGVSGATSRSPVMTHRPTG